MRRVDNQTLRFSKLNRNEIKSLQSGNKESESQKDFEEVFFSSILKESDIEEKLEKLNEVSKKIEKELSESVIEEYRKSIQDILSIIRATTKIVEKTSLKSKNKKLKILISADQELTSILHEVMKKEIDKMRLLKMSKEVESIILSILA